MSTLSMSCVQAFVAPTADEPHAVLKVRLVYHSTPGPTLFEDLRIGEHRLPVPEPVRLRSPGTTGTFHTRIAPGPTHFAINNGFFHTELRRRMRTRTERYACGTQRTGYGNTARTTTRYCTRNRQEWVTETVRVNDGNCRADADLGANVGDTYVLQYDFFAHGRCSIRVLRELQAPDGSLRLIPN